MTTRTPWQVLEHLVATDQTAPRVTFYERTPGPTQGERIELSAKVLTNWVSKAANLLSEELDVDASSSVIVHLPAAHWRTAYWCLAVWSLGAQVVFVDADDDDGALPSAPIVREADVLVTSNPADEVDSDIVVVTLAMLARRSSAPLPTDAIDEAQELSTFGDVFTPFDVPAPTAAALTVVTGGGIDGLLHVTDMSWKRVSHPSQVLAVGDMEDLLQRHAGRHFLASPSPELLAGVLAGGGSVVLVRGDMEAADLARLLEQESAQPR